jgi:hypothetical protein
MLSLPTFGVGVDRTTNAAPMRPAGFYRISCDFTPALEDGRGPPCSLIAGRQHRPALPHTVGVALKRGCARALGRHRRCRGVRLSSHRQVLKAPRHEKVALATRGTASPVGTPPRRRSRTFPCCPVQPPDARGPEGWQRIGRPNPSRAGWPPPVVMSRSNGTAYGAGWT